MANPQPTDAHLRIPHTITEALMMSDFTKRQRKIIDLILRLSWGCGKNSAAIPRQRDFEVLGIRETHMGKELSRLVESRVIFIEGSDYSFNGDYDEWRVPRARPYMPERITELVRLNLNGTYRSGKSIPQELTKMGSSNLPQREVPTYEKSKFSTPELVLPKQILNKDKNKDHTHSDIHSLLRPEEAQNIQKHQIWLGFFQ